VGLVLAAACVASTHAATVVMNSPALDKWYYGNVPATVGGDYPAAPVFAFVGDADIDRIGGMLIGFNTAAAQIPSGLGAGSYQITSVRLTITVASNGTFNYDPTYDSYRVHLDPENPNYLADSDAGYPVEVYGVGLRNGYTTLSGTISGSTGPRYHEHSAYGPANSPNAFPLGQTGAGQPLIDVNDSVDGQLEAQPFAIGTSSLAPGESVPSETSFTFNLQVSDPSILAYLQHSLDTGILGLYVSSLYPAEGQGGPVTYPRFFSKEGANELGAPEFAPHLEIEYTTIPEPRTSVLLIGAISLIAAGRAFRQRHHLT
jgi:hypothetical protein